MEPEGSGALPRVCLEFAMRYGVNKFKSAKKFRKQVGRSKAINMAPVVMRGGYRL